MVRTGHDDAMSQAPAPDGPLVVLGSGYAGLTVAQEVHRRSKGKIPVVLVDRSPVHVLRTQLYEIDRIARAEANVRPWAVPLSEILDSTSVSYRAGTVRSIDLAQRTVELDSGSLAFRSLAICLGNVPAYYGVPGAEANTHSVYRLSAAQRLGRRLREIEAASPKLAGERRPRIIVVGGGSTGTELSAEIATADWTSVAHPQARAPEVVLLTGTLPFLDGLPPRLVEHARRMLHEAGVAIVYGWNVVRVDADRLELDDGTVLVFDAAIWCAGLQAAPLIRELPVPHGHGGRIAVDEHLEIPGFPRCFAVGDVIEYRDPSTGLTVPGTAQAALAEARVAAENLVARWSGQPLAPFHYRERGTIVAVGQGRGAGNLGRLTLWGRPAALVKKLVQRDYSNAVEKGETSRVL